MSPEQINVLYRRAEKAEAEVASLHDAIARNDETHAEAIAAVRARAEMAEGEVARLRGWMAKTVEMFRAAGCEIEARILEDVTGGAS